MNAEQGRIVAATELFRSDDLLVRRVGGFGGPICYVTFDSYTDHRTLDRPGFGEHHFRARGIDAREIHSPLLTLNAAVDHDQLAGRSHGGSVNPGLHGRPRRDPFAGAAEEL